MALYQAYGLLTQGATTRPPFLLDVLGTTPVAISGTTPVLDVVLSVADPTVPAKQKAAAGTWPYRGLAFGSAKGLAVDIWILAKPGRDLRNLTLTVVINQSGSTEGTAVVAGETDFVVFELRTGPEPVPAVLARVGQVTSATHRLDAGPPADDRVEDLYLVEAVTGGGPFPLHVVGGLATGPMVTMPGRRIRPTGAYGEDATTIRGIDLRRVRPNPPPTATSPRSATWFDVAARAPKTAAATRLQAIAAVPHAGSRPSWSGPADAPTAMAGSVVPASLAKGSYSYRFSYVYANGNESPLSDTVGPVTIANDGTIRLDRIPTGGPPPAGSPELAVVARRVYRRGPAEPDRLGGVDNLLVAQLPGPAASNRPNPLPTMLVDDNPGIKVGTSATTLASGHFRYPARLGVRYAADVAQDLRGTVLLVEPGAGATGVSSYGGSVTSAPTEVEVVQDDRAALRKDLQDADVEAARVTWTADTVVPRLTVQLPDLTVDPYGAGVDVRVDGGPRRFGLEWATPSGLLTYLDLRGQHALSDIDDPMPAFEGIALGPDAFDRVAVRIGAGHPAAAWPEGEATLGVELRDVDARHTTTEGTDLVFGRAPFGAVAARGLRWARMTNGTGFPGIEQTSTLDVQLLLGADPDRPPGGDRTLRFLQLAEHGPPPPWLDDDVPLPTPQASYRRWVRAGVLPDRLSLRVGPIHTGQPTPGDADATPMVGLQAVLAGRVQRIVGNVLDDEATKSPPHGGGTTTWFSVDSTGPIADRDDSGVSLPTSLFAYADAADQVLGSTAPLNVDASVRSGPGDRRRTVHARLRLPTDVTAHVVRDVPRPERDQTLVLDLEAKPDGAWGRVAVAEGGGRPLAAPSNPQLQMRRLPNEPSDRQLDALTGRIPPTVGVNAVVQPAIPNGPSWVDPRSRVQVKVALAADRPNRSVRGDQWEIDPRVPSGPRRAIKGRLGEVADQLGVEIVKDESNGGRLFFLKGTTSTPIRDGEIWALPTQLRAAGAGRGEYAGLGNISVTALDELPTAFEYVDFASVPFSVRGMPEYGGAEQLPTVHAPSSAATVEHGGLRLRLTGRAAARGIRVAVFAGDEYHDIGDQNRLGGGPQWSKWTETLVPKLDLRADPAGPGGQQTLWVWLYTVKGTEDVSGKAFRFSDGLLADLAMRDYVAHDSPDRASTGWDEIEPGTYTTTIYKTPTLGGMPEPETSTSKYGTWEYQTDVQLKGYRGELTIVDGPTLGAKLGNPYGDWEAGPGEWYLRARDKLELILYTGDLFMGNTGNGDHVPASNGLFSTLRAPYLLVWPKV